MTLDELESELAAMHAVLTAKGHDKSAISVTIGCRAHTGYSVDYHVTLMSAAYPGHSSGPHRYGIATLDMLVGELWSGIRAVEPHYAPADIAPWFDMAANGLLPHAPIPEIIGLSPSMFPEMTTPAREAAE